MSARLHGLAGQHLPNYMLDAEPGTINDRVCQQHTAALFAVTGPANVLTRLAHAIYRAATVHNAATDPHLREYVLDPLLDAFTELLNYDRGGLDGGTCSAWAESVREWMAAQQ